MNRFLNLASLLLFVAVFGLSACKKEGCTDSMAENYDAEAEENDNSCTYARTKFLGDYSANQSCVYEGNSNFSMSVSVGPNMDEVMLNNFGNWGINIRAKINGGNITFKEEQNGITYEGSGYINGNTMTINYEACETFYYPCSDPESCTITATK